MQAALSPWPVAAHGPTARTAPHGLGEHRPCSHPAPRAPGKDRAPLGTPAAMGTSSRGHGEGGHLLGTRGRGSPAAVGTAPRREQGEGAGALQPGKPSRVLQQFWDTAGAQDGPAEMMAMDGVSELGLVPRPRKQSIWNHQRCLQHLLGEHDHTGAQCYPGERAPMGGWQRWRGTNKTATTPATQNC